MIGIGIIGCGKIAQIRHLPEFAENPHAKILGLYDLNTPRAEDMARQYGGTAYASYQELLDNPDIRAVCVLSANDAHAKITIDALRAGKHVLCEKPMATSLEDCQSMVDAANATGNFLMIGHNQRLAGAHAKARELIKDGLIGDIITFQTNFGHSGADNWSVDGRGSWFFDKSKACFGAIADLGIHKTDLIQFLTGQRVKAVQAFVGTLQKKTDTGVPIAVDDNAVCIYHLEGGAVGTMTASWTRYGAEDNSTVLYGSEGIMSIYRDPAHSIVVNTKDGTTISYDLDQIQTNDNQTKSGVIDLFVDCILNNTPPEISGESALSAMKAIFAALRSSESGELVYV